ncbi:Kae1-associated serine/threonine protein kinase [Candidatus Woesearchaeota archaeon]|nr:Kae1-associated serine/threonine protein kinase [Candidatus Woesearchaeota archaeon]
MQKIAQGAEAKLFQDREDIIKQRFQKEYRHPLIDNLLRKQRTRRESRILEKLAAANFPSPRISDFDDKNMEIRMDMIEGSLIRDVLHEKHAEFSREIGKRIAQLHNKDIIHGDLTTSNMILAKETNKINLIDFGLSFVSEKIEDKAVDIHLLRQALESKHHTISDDCFSNAVKAYTENALNGTAVLERLQKVEVRGRHKSRK